MNIRSQYALHWELCGEPGKHPAMAHSYERVYDADEVDEEIARLRRVLKHEEEKHNVFNRPRCECETCQVAREAQ